MTIPRMSILTKKPEPPSSVFLSLSKDQASFLVDILYRIGGVPETTRRKIADEICTSLKAIGIKGTERRDMDGFVFMKSNGSND